MGPLYLKSFLRAVGCTVWLKPYFLPEILRSVTIKKKILTGPYRASLPTYYRMTRHDYFFGLPLQTLDTSSLFSRIDIVSFFKIEQLI